MMPENGGIGVLAHEYGHNLGADDLYAYGGGETSAGFWTLMADDWTGYPLGFQPPAVDPWHLDGWGWLDPEVISDPSQGLHRHGWLRPATSPAGRMSIRGVKIDLPEDSRLRSRLRPTGSLRLVGRHREPVTNATMTLQEPIAIPAGGATLDVSIRL